MTKPTQKLGEYAKQVVCYTWGRRESKLTWCASKVKLPVMSDEFESWSDSSWADVKQSRKSTSCHYIACNNVLVHWWSKVASILTTSTTETELISVTTCSIGGDPVKATQDKKSGDNWGCPSHWYTRQEERGRPPKKPDESSRHSYKKRDTRLCVQCVSSNRSEDSKTCKGSGGAKFCQYLNSQDLGTEHGVPQNTSGFLEG